MAADNAPDALAADTRDLAPASALCAPSITLSLLPAADRGERDASALTAPAAAPPGLALLRAALEILSRPGVTLAPEYMAAALRPLTQPAAAARRVMTGARMLDCAKVTPGEYALLSDAVRCARDAAGDAGPGGRDAFARG